MILVNLSTVVGIAFGAGVNELIVNLVLWGTGHNVAFVPLITWLTISVVLGTFLLFLMIRQPCNNRRTWGFFLNKKN